MNLPVISIEGISKKYQINRGGNPTYSTLRETLVASVQRTLTRFRELSSNKRTITPYSTEDRVPKGQSRKDDLWALRNVSFEIMKGQVVGIIGRNGAGKSTLLKILSRITEPTEGKIRIRGRIASLLEIGTGFHPELTGRENVFLNGAILGLRRIEIQRKFDEIVAFAEIERFLDTPVKRYSSGMYVRLAFAVAAHLDPEILIVDEVLAVGDHEFQKKCLGKIEKASKGEGRTVLFVSHQLGIIRELCDVTILLAAGKVQCIGKTPDVISQYLSTAAIATNEAQVSRYISSVSSEISGMKANLFFNEKLELFVQLNNLPNVPLGLNVSIRNGYGRLLCLFSTNPHDGMMLPRKSEMKISFCMEQCCLAPGEYSIDIALTEPTIRIIEEVIGVFHFEVYPKRIGGSWAYENRFGDFFPPHNWNVIA